MVFYNLTPSREVTQPWCESPPWDDSDQCAAYIPSRASTNAVLPYVLLVLILPTHRRMEGWINPMPGLSRYWTQDLSHDSLLLYQLSYPSHLIVLPLHIQWVAIQLQLLVCKLKSRDTLWETCLRLALIWVTKLFSLNQFQSDHT